MSLADAVLDDFTVNILSTYGSDTTGDLVIAAAKAIDPVNDVGFNANQNSKALIQARSGSTKYSGQAVVFYQRVNLATLATFNPYKIQMPAGDSILNHLDVVMNQYGIFLTSDDVQDSQTVLNGDGTVSVTLTAKATSLTCTGSGTLTFAGPPSISQLFSSNILANF